MVSADANTLRFIVGQPGGLVSSAYRIWTNANGGDIYVSASGVLRWGAGKLSLHGSGKWRAVFRASGQPPVGAAWDRPPPFAPGWVHALDLVVPSEELRPGDVPAAASKWRWVPAPRPGYGVVVSILVSTAGRNFLPATMPGPGGAPADVAFRRPLSDADVAWVLVAETPMLPYVNDIAATWKRRVNAPSGSRGFVFGEVGDGARYLLDLGFP